MNVRISKAHKIQILNTESVYKIMQQVLLRENEIRRKQEHFWIIGLDAKSKILFIELISLGAENRVFVKAMEVYRMSVYKLASKIILVHNHPNGIVHPSEADFNFTNYLLKTGELLGLEVIDHLIISETDYLSFKELGAIEKLKKSKAYRIVKGYDEELEQIKLKAAEDKGKKDLAIDIAKKMLHLGNTIEMIKDFTGLTIRQIEKIKKELE